MNTIKAIFAYLTSLFKKEWKLEDYPIRYQHQEVTAEENLGRLEPIPWTVQIINWWQMTGYGDTQEEAYLDLVENFNRYKQENKHLPRPGTGVPIEFAETTQIEAYQELAKDFCPKILDMDFNDIFITDESSLWDFHAEDSNQEYIERIKEVYGVDVSNIEDGKLVKIFKKIRANNYA